MKQVNYPLSPHVRRCVRFYGDGWSVDTPAGDRAVFGGRFRGIFVRVRPFENGTMIKGGTHKGAPPTHKAPQRGSFSAFGQGTHFQETQNFR